MAAAPLAGDNLLPEDARNPSARVDGQEPVQVVQATGERVRKTALGILDQLDTFQVANGTPPGLTRDVPASEASSRSAAPLPERPSAGAPALAGRGL